jgi:hypothetical protein
MRRILGRDRTPLLESRWRFAAIAGLAAFVIVDVVLVVVAVHGVAPQPATTPGPIPTYTSTPMPSPTATPTSTSSPTPTATPGTAGTTSDQSAGSGTPTLLSAVSATEAWRVTSGTCPASSGATSSTGTSAVVEHSTDAGKTWTALPLGGQAVDTALALDAGSSKTTVVGGRTSSCGPVATTSFTTGQFWADSASDLASEPYVVPGGASLHLSTGTVDSPCATPSRVLEGSTQTAVVCDDGLQVRSGSGPWTSVALTGLDAVAPTPGAFTIARTGVSGCDGVEIQTLSVPVSSSSTPKSLGCASVTSTTLTSADVALARAGSSLWLWAGPETLVSKDGGASW